MFHRNKDAQRLSIRTNARLLPIWFTFYDLIVKPAKGGAPSHFDVHASPSVEGRTYFVRPFNPVRERVAAIAVEPNHFQNVVARVGAVGERQGRAGERNVEDIDGKQIGFPGLPVDIYLDIERLCLRESFAQGPASAADVVRALSLLSFGPAFDKRGHEANSKTFGAEIILAVIATDFHQMKGLDMAAPPLFRQFSGRACDAHRTRKVIGATQRDNANWHGSVGQVCEDITDRAVAAGGNDDIGRVLQRPFQTVIFRRDVVDLDIGQMQSVNDGIFIVAFDPGRRTVHQKRPHDAITVLVQACSRRVNGAGRAIAVAASSEAYPPDQPGANVTRPTRLIAGRDFGHAVTEKQNVCTGESRGPDKAKPF
jgi:hypothetical protein